MEDIDRKIAQLKEQRQQLVARERDRERKQRNHALIVFGAMVEEACGGDWTAVDPQALSAYLAKWSRSMRKAAAVEPVGSAAADAALRAWEKSRRDAAKAERAAVGAALAGAEGGGPHDPVAFRPGDPRVSLPERDDGGCLVWDFEDPDDDGAIYDPYATR